MEQKNWAVVRTVVGYHRYDTPAELALLNKIWMVQSLLTNYFCPQQKLISEVRDGAKVIKKYDRATTPHGRAADHDGVTAQDKNILADNYAAVNPAAVHREIQALTDRLQKITISKAAARAKPPQSAAHHDRSTSTTH